MRPGDAGRGGAHNAKLALTWRLSRVVRGVAMSFDADGVVPPEEEVFEDPNGGVPRKRRGTGGDGGEWADLDGTLEDAALEAVHGVATTVLRNSLVPFGLVPGSPEDESGGGGELDAAPQEAADYEQQQQQHGGRDGYGAEEAPLEVSRKRGGRGGGQQGGYEPQQRPSQEEEDDEQLQWFGTPGSVDVVGDLLSGFLASGAGLVNDAARALTTGGLAVFPEPGADHDASFRRFRGRRAAARGDTGTGDDAAQQDVNEVPEELLELAVEEGFQRAEAKACCLRVAAAYGVSPGDLSIDFAGDLVLQALTEERAHPGVLFVKPAAAVPLAQQHALRRRNRPRDGSGTDTASGGGWTSDVSAFLSFRAPAVAAVRARQRKQLLTCIDALQILVLGSLAIALVLLYLRGGPTVVGVALAKEAALRTSAVHFWTSAPTLSPTFLAAASGDVTRLRTILNAARDAAASATAHKAGKRRDAGAEDISSAHHVQNAAMAAVSQDGAARGGRRARLGGSATPVAAAVSGGHGGALAALLAAGASVNEGVTLGPPFAPGLHISPLAIAAVRGHVACAAALLHAGADPDEGITAYVLGLRIPLLRLSPLGLALSAGYGPVARALLRAGSHAHVCGSLLAGNMQVPCLTAAAGATSQKQATESTKAGGGKAHKSGAMPMGKSESSLEVLHSWHDTSATASGTGAAARTGRGSAATAAASSAAAAAAAAQQRAAAARTGVHGLAGSKQDNVVLQAARRAADAAHDAAVRAAAEAELAELESSRLAVVAADAAMVAAVERGVDGGEL